MCAKLLDSIGFVSNFDPEIASMMGRELDRQEDGIELIASENFASPAVIAAITAGDAKFSEAMSSKPSCWRPSSRFIIAPISGSKLETNPIESMGFPYIIKFLLSKICNKISSPII